MKTFLHGLDGKWVVGLGCKYVQPNFVVGEKPYFYESIHDADTVLVNYLIIEGEYKLPKIKKSGEKYYIVSESVSPLFWNCYYLHNDGIWDSCTSRNNVWSGYYDNEKDARTVYDAWADRMCQLKYGMDLEKVEEKIAMII